MKTKAIFGPPGTGKTRTLVDMANYTLKEQGRSVLFLSYTKAAAQEVTSRIEGSEKISASTAHAIAFRTLSMTKAMVVDRKKLYDFGKQTGFAFKGADDNMDEIQEGDEYLSVLSYANNRMVTIEEAYAHFGAPGTWPMFQVFAQSYQSWKDAFGYMDFDDMLMRYVTSGSPAAQDCVFLDEAQDCSPLQWMAISRMCSQAKHVVIAGDDDQAIYEWNGADPHGMISWVDNNKAQIKVLDQSHRVPKVAHDLAHEVTLFKIGKRFHKNFNPRAHEGKFERYGDFNDIDVRGLYANGGGMVLARDRYRLEEIKRGFNRDMIPYEVLGGGSPWTSRIAQELRRGGTPDIPLMWRDFYAQADLTLPINISLSTIHQAKGRESHRVLIDLTMPSRVLVSMYNDRDAELRVWYVALTRTSDELIICGENPIL